jgi:predicted Zn-dependent peptidase
MSPDVAPQVIGLMLEELEKIKATPVDAIELRRAKESIKGSLMLSLESTDSRMFKLGRSELYHGRQISLDELMARIDAVTADDVQAMAAALFDPRQLTMAGIGPFRADGTLAASMRTAFEQYAGSRT